MRPNEYTVDQNGCWIWPLVDRKGYGRLARDGRAWSAHRFFYTQANGPIPEGMTVDHLCFVPACCNPAHLRLLTLTENVRNQRSARKTHCSNGHEYTEANTYIRPDASRGGTRDCRTCIRDRVRKYKQTRGAA